jgi:hypothetical protein
MVAIKADNRALLAAVSTTFRRLGRLSGFSPDRVLRAEAGVILKTWAGRTKVATLAQADRRTRLRTIRTLGLTRGDERGAVTVNAGFRPAPFGRVWIRVREGAGRGNWILAKGPNFSAPSGPATFTLVGRQLYNPGNRGDTDRSTSMQWMENVEAAQRAVEFNLKRAIPRGRGAIGLARQSVLQIADSLGIDLLRVEGGGALSAAGIAKARAALASSGKAHRNGFGRSGGDQLRPYVDLFNRLPYGTAIGMDRTLLGVLAGRVKFFERSYAKGAFNFQHTATKAYPNLFRFSSSLN